MGATNLLPPEEHVLATLNRDGSRRWLRPVVSRGRFLAARRAVAWFLIAVFVLLPYARIGGRPAVLLDVVSREFTILGRTFLPTDTVLLALLVVGLFLGIFLVTALFGRVWCGWACPQTVYMEFVFRPIERLLDGAPRRARRRGVLPALKYPVYGLIALALAHTFLAYFVGVERLAQWVQRSPVEHPQGFLVVAATTALILFDFAFFREQTCLVACPYGRLQSVLLDRDSLIVSYDKVRGEPRTRKRRDRSDELFLPLADRRGDCVDCGLCVATCPTGIDIRDGLQMECIGCAQCIDACDAVMTRLSRPRGLIRYSSQNAVERRTGRRFRPRLVVYPTLMTLALGLFAFLLASARPADVSLVRGRGMPFTLVPFDGRPEGGVANTLVLKIANRTVDPRTYTFAVVEPAGSTYTTDADPLVLGPGKSASHGLLVTAPRSVFREGAALLRLRVADDHGFETVAEYKLAGPWGHAAESAPPADGDPS